MVVVACVVVYRDGRRGAGRIVSVSSIRRGDRAGAGGQGGGGERRHVIRYGPAPQQGRAAEEGDGARRRAEPVLAGVIVAVNVTGVPNVAEPGVKVRAVVVAIGVTGGDTVNVADSMSEFATGVVEVVADALPTATTGPLLRAVTPVRPSWLLPGFALVTGLQLVPFHCAAIVPKPVCSPFELEKPSPTAKILLDAVPEMAAKVFAVFPFEKAAWDQVVPLKFQMPPLPTTQTSVAEIASTAIVASLPYLS